MTTAASLKMTTKIRMNRALGGLVPRHGVGIVCTVPP
jgi:hypothetical protein